MSGFFIGEIMSDVQWIKITTNVFDDEKIRLIEMLPEADAVLIIWFKLLAMAGKCNDSGLIYLSRDIPYNDEMLSTLMRKPVNTIRLALQEFVNLKMIEIHNDFIAIINWEKHQNIEKLDLMREQSRLSSQKYREKQKKMLENGDVTVIESDATEKRREEKRREEKSIDMFNQIWDLYEKKTNKEQAFKAFKKVKESDYNNILDHIPKYVQSTPDKGYRKNLATYLNNSCWNDEIIIKQINSRRENAAIEDYNKMSDMQADLILSQQKQLEE